MGYHTRVTLKREKRWKGNVFYYLTTEKVYSDETTETIETTTYQGKERHKAIQAFEDIKKQYAGYEYIKDIEKGRWE